MVLIGRSSKNQRTWNGNLRSVPVSSETYLLSFRSLTPYEDESVPLFLSDADILKGARLALPVEGKLFIVFLSG